jgi:hypothetical protein
LIVIPATILITGIGFSLGTLWPRRTRLIMLGILIGWILFFTVGDVLRINPTGTGILGTIVPQLIRTANTNLASIPADQRAEWVQQLQATLPDLRAWVLPQAGLAIASFLLVAVSAGRFKRFRNELD